MNWQDIRKDYPERWLLVEAINAHTEANKRILNQIAVVGTFSNSITALESYKQLHHQFPERELYVFHTSREKLDIIERTWLGVRI
ncbi:MAG: hypothetical protein V1872_12650 [bacterium]